MGNSPPVAARQYLSVREVDHAEALQNPVQQAAAPGCNDLNRIGGEEEKPREVQTGAVPCVPVQRNPMTLTGFEPVSQP